jgi:hypothetical protein
VDYYLSQLALWRDMELLRVEDQGLRFAREGLDPTATDDVGSATEEQGEAAAPQETR